MALLSSLSELPQDYVSVTFPLECIYTPPGLSPQKDITPNFPRYEEMIAAYKSIAASNPGLELWVPLDERRNILSGMDQFLRFVKETPYRYYWADMALIAYNVDKLCKIVDGQIYTETCIGNGEKTYDFIQRLENCGPRYIIANDIFSGNIETSFHRLTVSREPVTWSTRKKSKKDRPLVYPAGQTIKMPGNILEWEKDKFWPLLKETVEKIRKFPDDRVSLWMLGATWNDFDASQRRKILRSAQTPCGTRPSIIDDLVFAIDNTTKREPLKKFYYHLDLLNMGFTGLAWHASLSSSKEKLGYPPKLGMSDMQGHLVIEEGEKSTKLYMAYQSDKQKRVYISHAIEKPREEETMKEFEIINGFAENRDQMCQRMVIDERICASKESQFQGLEPLLGTYGFWHVNLSSRGPG